MSQYGVVELDVSISTDFSRIFGATDRLDLYTYRMLYWSMNEHRPRLRESSAGTGRAPGDVQSPGFQRVRIGELSSRRSMTDSCVVADDFHGEPPVEVQPVAGRGVHASRRRPAHRGHRIPASRTTAGESSSMPAVAIRWALDTGCLPAIWPRRRPVQPRSTTCCSPTCIPIMPAG